LDRLAKKKEVIFGLLAERLILAKDPVYPESLANPAWASLGTAGRCFLSTISTGSSISALIKFLNASC
jgi:hypothetical protein